MIRASGRLDLGIWASRSGHIDPGIWAFRSGHLGVSIWASRSGHLGISIWSSGRLDLGISIGTLSISVISDFDTIWVHCVIDEVLSYNDTCLADYLEDIYENKFETYAKVLSQEQAEEKGFDFTIQVDLKDVDLENQKVIDETIKQLSLLKRHALGAIFNYHIDMQKAGQESKLTTIPTRGSSGTARNDDSESIWIYTDGNQIYITFNTKFEDKDDNVLAKSFLQELNASANKGKNGPHVEVKDDSPPGALENEPRAYSGKGVRYITFTLNDGHLKNEQKIERAIDLLHSFRTYLHYHIKCAKAYIRGKMRVRTEGYRESIDKSSYQSRYNSKYQS